MKRNMKLAERIEKRVDPKTLVRVTGRVKKELRDKGYAIMKKNRISWNSLLHTSLQILVDQDKDGKKR